MLDLLCVDSRVNATKVPAQVDVFIRRQLEGLPVMAALVVKVHPVNCKALSGWREAAP